MPKKKQTTEDRRKIRLRKGRQWALAYQGSYIVRDCRKRFGVDNSCAMKDLAEIGALSPEARAEMQQAEQMRLEQLLQEQERTREEEVLARFPDSNDQFYYIIGYTSGGAPYGVTWEEMGLGPWNWEDEEQI